MACFIPKNILTKELINRIHTDLSITDTNESKTLQFYLLKPDGLCIPFMYSAALFKEFFNQKLNYPKIDFVFKSILFPNQVEVFNECMVDIKSKGTCIINVPPGYGKTMLGSRILTELKLITCVLVHREILVNQWNKTFTDSLENPKILIVGQNDHLFNSVLPEIIICMDQRAKTLPENLINKVGLLIVDEAHCFCTSGRINSILLFNPKNIIIETATLERNDSLHRVLHLLCGNKKVFRPIEKDFTVYKVETGVEIPSRSDVRGKLDWNYLVTGMINSKIRNDLIHKIVIKNPDKKILIITSRIDHVKTLENLLTGLSVATMSGNKKNYKDSKILIGTISKIGTGFDEKNACEDFGGQVIDLVILATSIKDLALFEQVTGRSRSKTPILYDLVDKNFILKSHYRQRLGWYNDKGAEILTFSHE